MLFRSACIKRLPFHIKSKLHKPKNIYKKNLVQLHKNITKSNEQALEQKTPNNEIPNIISHTQKHDQNTHQTMNNILRKKKIPLQSEPNKNKINGVLFGDRYIPNHFVSR